MDKNNKGLTEVGIGYLINKTALHFKINCLQLFKENNFSLTPEQFGILFFLSKEDGMYQRQLAKVLLKDRPNITRLIDILEDKGFVYREIDPANRRIFKIHITEKGRQQSSEIHPHLIEMQKKAAVGITHEEISVFRKILGKICENLDDDFKLQI